MWVHVEMAALMLFFSFKVLIYSHCCENMARLELYSAGVLHCQAHAHSFSEGGGVDGVHLELGGRLSSGTMWGYDCLMTSSDKGLSVALGLNNCHKDTQSPFLQSVAAAQRSRWMGRRTKSSIWHHQWKVAQTFSAILALLKNNERKWRCALHLYPCHRRW